MALAVGTAGAEAPFKVAPAWQAGGAGAGRLTVTLTPAPDHYVYADKFQVTVEPPAVLAPETVPPPVAKYDEFAETNVLTYAHVTTFAYQVTGAAANLAIGVAYQGCGNGLCYPPELVRFRLQGGAFVPVAVTAPAAAPASAAPVEGWAAQAEHFTLAGRESGYLDKTAFLAFLDRAAAGQGTAPDALQTAWRKRGLGAVVLLILLGGLLLNLTPCVLPMIPVNLAIIGAGARAGSRWRGFLLGGTYGIGMLVVYGVLGLAVVLAGAKFGALNASPWFNLAIALVFGVMGLGLFDVFAIDLSRFQGQGPAGARRGGFAAALVLGGLAALLAGACVAPVLISVLLLAADLYARGQAAGLLLPFLLGAGMALPWPFAGAGLAFLPKPGRWMNRVKYAFGVLILLMALWYGYLGITLVQARVSPDSVTAHEAVELAAKAGWRTSLDEGLALARRERKPVFIDLWASWCKNCLKMEKATFQDTGVRARLDGYVRIKYRAEDLGDPAVKAVMDHFGAVGLPTYVILQPKE